MSTPSHFRMMAEYNEWMKARLYETAGKLPAGDLALDRGAFFGSVIGTLNHLVVTDTMWLKRFAAHPSNPPALEPIRALSQPTVLNQVLFTDLGDLLARRKVIDAAIKAWAAALKQGDLDHVLRYANSKGVKSQKRMPSLLAHLFNHQTHHRSQALTLFTQAGQDVGTTDLLALIPNEI